MYIGVYLDNIPLQTVHISEIQSLYLIIVHTGMHSRRVTVYDIFSPEVRIFHYYIQTNPFQLFFTLFPQMMQYVVIVLLTLS